MSSRSRISALALALCAADATLPARARELQVLSEANNRALALAGSAATLAASARELKVFSEPNNLPFSNRAGEGFENRIAALVAGDRDARVEYTWWAQRRGFVRNTLKAGDCDVVMGVPTGFELARTTRPYYRSSYVFVAR